MKKYIFIIITLLFIYFYFFGSETIYKFINLSPVKQNNKTINLDNNNNLINNSDIHTDIDVDINIDDIISNDVKHTDIQYSENQFSETTSNLISTFYDKLTNDIYKKVSLVINMHDRDIPIDITLFNIGDSDNNLSYDKLTNNFIELFRYYVGSTIFKFDPSNGLIFMGDYLNNNGTANYNAGRNMIQINNADSIITNFIPALSISMVTTSKNSEDDNIYIGSQFCINIDDVNNASKKYKLIPFGKCTIDSNYIQYISHYYEKIASNNSMRPSIKSITLINDNNNNNDDEQIFDINGYS
jgi:hypothetical protein